MSFTASFLNQAGALVHIYTDGTVLVTHGGCEMGQGTPPFVVVLSFLFALMFLFVRARVCRSAH